MKASRNSTWRDWFALIWRMTITLANTSVARNSTMK